MRNSFAILLVLLFQGTAVFGFCNAEFTYNLGSNSQQLVFFNQSQAGGEIMQFYWDFGDGQVSLETNPVHNYTKPGRYQVFLTVITPSSCVNVRNKELYVGINAYPDACGFAISVQTHNATQPDYNNAWIMVTPDVPFSVFSVTWSNGSTAAFIDNLTPGVYCVTMSDINGCYATDCFEIGYNNNCIASILIDSSTYYHIPGCYRFINNSHGEYSQLRWDFGDGYVSYQESPVHIYDEPGEYLVWLYFESYYGCSDSTSRLVQVPEVVPLLNIEGVVHVGENLLPEGKAVLYQKNNNRYDAKKSADIFNGVFHFENLDIRENFIIHVIPYFDVNEVYFPKYLATYYSDSISWQRASLINLPNDTLIDINLYRSDEVYFGGAKIYGHVFYSVGASYELDIFGISWFDLGNDFAVGRAANMVVVLLNQSRRPMNTVLTRNDGYYEFGNLEAGTYYVRIEKAGLVSQEIMVVIEGDGDLQVPDFVIHASIIQTDIQKANSENKLIVYPNPTDDILFIENAMGSNVCVFSALGAKVIEFNADSDCSVIDLSILQGNEFTIVVKNGEQTISRKVIKN